MRCWIFLFLIIPVLGFSQCEDSDKLDFGGTRLSKSRNHIPFTLEISDTIQYCCDIKKIKTYSDFILSKSKAFIIARANDDFFKKLEIDRIDVNYDDSVEIAYANQSLYSLSNFNITYWIIYTYSNNNIKYAFGLEFDKNGEMISENKFPDFTKNKMSEVFTDICSALNLLKYDTRFSDKKIDLIELTYLDEINSFCWLVKEKMKPIEELGKSIDYSLDLFYVNANTNKLEKIRQQTGRVIACGGVLSKKKIKKVKLRK